MGKSMLFAAAAGLVALSVATFGGLVPLAVVLSGLLAYAAMARQRTTLNADRQEQREARVRVAASTVSCEWVKPE